MIFMGTYTMPSNKTDEWIKCMSDMAENQIPSVIKKWQTYTCYDGDGSRGYNLIFTERGKEDEELGRQKCYFFGKIGLSIYAINLQTVRYNCLTLSLAGAIIKGFDRS